MSILEKPRKDVLDYLDGPILWKEAIKLIDKWFKVYKQWEFKDSFEQAFKDNRLTIRTYTPGSDVSKGFSTKVEYFEEDAKGYKRDRPETKDKYKFRTGLSSIQERMKPEHFTDGRKYELGLHDLSATLVNKEGLKTQHTLKKGNLVVFMPLPEPEDLALFDTLNQISKTFNHTLLRKKMREIASKMTRIKSAYGKDMGAGYVAIKSKKGLKSKSKDKIRYRSKKTDILGKENVDCTINYGNLWSYMKKNTLDYKTILKCGGKSELIISYRQHKSPDFPMFTKYNGGGEFQVYNLKSGALDPKKPTETHKL